MERFVEYDYEAAERGFSAGYGITIVAFLILLWAIGAKSGPLKEWAEDHSTAAVVLLLVVPGVLGLIFG